MRRCFCSLVLLLSAGAAQAQMYKWVGPDGKINYTDTPPPASAKQFEKKETKEAEQAGADLPYSITEAVKGNPVTLFSSANCIPCDDGRNLLNSRGVPFKEKTIKTNDDIAQLRQAGGGDQLPLLLVGRSKQEGYSATNWHEALTAAGYPLSSVLPKNYRNPAPEAAAPAPTPTAMPQESAADTNTRPSSPTAGEPPPAAGNAPPGFRF